MRDVKNRYGSDGSAKNETFLYSIRYIIIKKYIIQKEMITIPYRKSFVLAEPSEP